MDDDSAKPSDPEPHTDAGRGGSALWFVWAFVLIMVIYPLSTGPATRLELKFPGTAPTIEALYRPIGLLNDNCHPFQVALRWYLVKVWQVPIPDSK